MFARRVVVLGRQAQVSVVRGYKKTIEQLHKTNPSVSGMPHQGSTCSRVRDRA